MRPTLVTLLLVVAALASSRAAHAAANLKLTFSPELPTWRDDVHLRVEGEVESACDPQAELSNVVLHFSRVDVDLSTTICPSFVETPPRPFVAELNLGKLAAREFQVFVHDLAVATESPMATLVVYDLPLIGIRPPELAVAGQPIQLEITSYSNGGGALVQVTPGVITVTYADFIPDFEPIPPFVNTTYVDLGALAPGDYDLRVFDTTQTNVFQPGALARFPLRVWDPARCVPGELALCLLGGRYRLTARWRDFDGRTGDAHALPIAGNDGSGVLWFFGADNFELTAKLVDGCSLNGQVWAFVASATSVEYHLTVEDTATGRKRTYDSALGATSPLIADVRALACGT